MSDSTNPIVLRMLHADRWPGPRASRVIGYGAGALLGLLLIVFVVRSPSPALLGLAVAAVPVFVAGLLALWLALSAGLTARWRRSEDYALLRLTPLTGEQIVAGCLAGVGYRLRLLRAASVGLPSGWGVATLCAVCVYGISSALAAVGLLIYIPCLALVLAAALIYLYAAHRLLADLSARALEAGVWLGLRHPRQAGLIAAGAGVWLVSLVLVSLALFSQSPLTALIYLPGLWLAAYGLLDGYREFFTLDAVAAVAAGLSDEPVG